TIRATTTADVAPRQAASAGTTESEIYIRATPAAIAAAAKAIPIAVPAPGQIEGNAARIPAASSTASDASSADRAAASLSPNVLHGGLWHLTASLNAAPTRAIATPSETPAAIIHAGLPP